MPENSNEAAEAAEAAAAANSSTSGPQGNVAAGNNQGNTQGAQKSSGGIFGGYTGIVDMFDGGGPGFSGATYGSGGGVDQNGDGFISVDEAKANPLDQNFFSSMSNAFGMTPMGANADGTMKPLGTKRSKSVAKTALLGFLMPQTLALPAAQALLGWTNNIKDTDKAEVIGNRTVYSKTDKNGDETGEKYSYNGLGFAYSVSVDSNGNVVDALSQKDENGQSGYDIMRDEIYEGEGTDAEKKKQIDEIDQLEEDNANETGVVSEARIMAEFVKEMLEDAGMEASNDELRAIMNDPVGFLQKNGSLLAEKIPNLDPETKGVLLDPESLRYRLGESPAIATAIVGDTATTDGVVNADAERFDAKTATDQLGTDATTVDAATGSITNENLVDAAQIDMQGAGTGRNADGTVSVTGEALNDFATQNISSLIDTSTVSGKLLAQKLGEGNYTDSKATILGQMEIISAEFKDSQGNPKVPQWAQALSRDVAKTMAFSGISGTAQTAAMANAIMEATLGIAQKEAAFFQTLTTKNLDNRQQAIINKATVMANFETANMDARQAAAIQNARSFLEMDLANLTNEQQAEVVNTQAMVDAIFNDQSAINAARLFGAEQANDMQKYYDNMNAQISLQNSEQINQMRKFNVGEINDGREFNSRLEQSRQEFYANMQYNLDLANAKWRQSVATTNTQMQFDAAETDVKNTLDLSLESMTRLWDRVDNHLDYIFKGWNAESDRDATILAAELRAQSQQQSGGNSFIDGLFSLGAAWLSSSDERLKENIEYYDTVKGIKFYTWDWNEEAKRVGADQYPTLGVIAQQVQKKYPNAVSVGEDGYLMVNYGEIQ